MCKLCHRKSAYHSDQVKYIAHRLAGGQASYLSLDDPERKSFRVRAKALYEDGLRIERASEEAADATSPDGDVYAIVNRAWPEYVKVGKARLAESRLRGYQTSGPFRDWTLAFASSFPDRHVAERMILDHLDEYRVIADDGTKTEWVKLPVDSVQECIAAFARTLNHQLENTS